MFKSFKSASGTVWLLPLLALAAQPSVANTIVSVVSPGSGTYGPAVQIHTNIQESWTQTQAYTNVAISVDLASWTPGETFNINAFLTTDTGPSGLPPALATTSLSGMTAQAGEDFQLFSGLTLGPGTYFLTLSGTDVGTLAGAIWKDYGGQTILDTGVTLGYPSSSYSPENTYPPALPFSQLIMMGIPLPAQHFTVTGEAVPEPSTVSTIIPAMAGMLLLGLAAKTRPRLE